MNHPTKLIAACSLGCMAASIAAVQFLGSNRTGGQAAIQLSRRHLDLGIVTWRKEREFAFAVGNKGQQRLVINQLACGCGTRESVARTLLIPPGESAELLLSLDTRFAHGAVEKSTGFTTNDPALPRFELSVRACVDAGPPVARPGEDQRKMVSVLTRGP